MRAFVRTAALAVAAATLCVALPARAQSDADRATARELGLDGQKALNESDFKRAESDFRRADSLVHAPTLLLGLARALNGEGKFVEAQEAYERIIREGLPAGASPAFVHALEAAKKEVPDLAAKFGGVTINVKGSDVAALPNATVTLDDAPVSAASLGVNRVANPGAHVVKASADGYKPAELAIRVTAGTGTDATLTLEKDLSAVPAPTVPAPVTPGTGTPGGEQASGGSGGSVLPWVAFGVGGAGLIAGGITGALALGKHSDLAKACTGGQCGPAQQSELSSYHTLGLVSTIGFIVAGVGAATGVTLLVVQPKAASAPDATPAATPPAAALVLGPGSLFAVGRF